MGVLLRLLRGHAGAVNWRGPFRLMAESWLRDRGTAPLRLWQADSGTPAGGPPGARTGRHQWPSRRTDSCLLRGMKPRRATLASEVRRRAAGPQGHEGAVTGVAFSPDGACLLWLLRTQLIRLWQVRLRGCAAGPWRGMPKAEVRSIAFFSGRQTLASGAGTGPCGSGRSSPAPRCRSRRSDAQPLRRGLSPDGRTLAAKGCGQRVLLAGRLAGPDPSLGDVLPSVTRVTFHPMVQARFHHTRPHCPAGGPTQVPRCRTLQTDVARVGSGLSPDGRILAAGVGDRTVRPVASQRRHGAADPPGT